MDVCILLVDNILDYNLVICKVKCIKLKFFILYVKYRNIKRFDLVSMIKDIEEFNFIINL